MASAHKLPTRVFPVPYQVDFSVESKGRHLDSTKRKLTWKFGFADPSAVFPHLHDADGNPISNGNKKGNRNNDATSTVTPKKGIECRGREHEIILTWSLLTGKAHIYVDSREIYRHEPIEDSLFNPFSASFHRGFDLPNAKFNGRHRIDIRCYARTPMGAKNMVVDNQGGKFRQYDLTVDGLSYFNFPAMYEIGTERMWSKVSRWGLSRQESLEEEIPRGGGMHGEHHGRDNKPNGRMVDEYYFDKKTKKDSRRFGESMSKSEYKAMNPRNESEEERMMRVAMEASMKDWERDAGYGKHTSPSNYSEENDSSYGNGQGKESSTQNRSSGAKKKKSKAKQMAPIGEDNLIDFGVDEASKAVSQITVSRHTSSDVSVLADNDDATTASFMMGTAWNSSAAVPPPPPQQYMSPQHPNAAQLYPNQQYQQQPQPPPHYHDPTFNAQYAQQQWTSTPSFPSSNPTTPRGVGVPSDASFAVPPPPTWDDYNDAFGGSTMNTGASVIGGGSTVMTNTYQQQQPMSPAGMSIASVGMASPMAQMQQPQQQPSMAQYNMQQATQWQSQSYGVGGPSMGASPKVSNANKFDPLRVDPFAS